MKNGRSRLVIEVALVAAAYYGAARLGLLMQLPGTNASPVWPPSGIGLAAVLLLGLRVWPGILIGAFLANLLTLPYTVPGCLASLGICVGNTLEPVCGLVLLRRLVPVGDPFERTPDVFRFFAIAAGACAVAATNGAASLWLTGIIPSKIYGSVWLTWWLGDLSGMLILAPAIVRWSNAPQLGMPSARLLELAALFAAIIAVSEMLFGGWFKSEVLHSLPYVYIVPYLIWSAFRFGQRETSLASVLVSVIAIWHTWSMMSATDAVRADAASLGPFMGGTLSANDTLLLLQIFISAVALTAETLASAVAGQRRDAAVLRESEQRFRTIFEQAAVGVAMIETATGRFLRLNQRYCDIVGYTADEMTGTTFQAITHPEDLQPDLEHMAQLVAGTIREFSLEKRYRRKDGGIVRVNLTVSATWHPDAKPEHHIAIVEDITERKRAEQAIQQYAADLERSNRDLDQFAYSASHDLKSPLRAIDNLAQWIAEDAGALLPAPTRADLELMQQRIKRMERLLDDLLAYSRVGRGASHKLETVETGALVREVLALLCPPETFTVEVRPLPTLTTHRAPLEQVFRNLIGNAIKHHDRRDGRVEVSSRDAGAFVELTIRDDGPGIPPEFHAQVFLMFQTLKPRDQVEGSGMGLALVKKIVENQRGQITLESAIGQGATFRFSWPKC